MSGQYNLYYMHICVHIRVQIRVHMCTRVRTYAYVYLTTCAFRMWCPFTCRDVSLQQMRQLERLSQTCHHALRRCVFIRGNVGMGDLH